MAVVDQVRHALGMAEAMPDAPRTVVDLGSGGGVPAVVLARLRWPEAQWCLVEANARRVAFLASIVDELGLHSRVQVVHQRAEEAARAVDLRHRFDLVVARSFGPPAVTAECAAPFLIEGGHVLVSEPPAGVAADRWPVDGLAALNLVLDGTQTRPVHVVRLRAVAACGERYPRRVGIPTKRPLF